MLPGAAGAERVDVVALVAHRNGELHRFDRAVLTDRFQEIRDLRDLLERQLGRVAGPIEQSGRKRATGFDGGWARPAGSRLAIGDQWFRGGQIRVLCARTPVMSGES